MHEVDILEVYNTMDFPHENIDIAVTQNEK